MSNEEAGYQLGLIRAKALGLKGDKREIFAYGYSLGYETGRVTTKSATEALKQLREAT